MLKRKVNLTKGKSGGKRCFKQGGASFFSDSVKGVIYQRNAFQPVSNGSIHDKADQDSIKAVKQVVKEHDRTTKAIYFYNPKRQQIIGFVPAKL